MAIRKPLQFLLSELSPHLRRIALNAIFARPSMRCARLEIYEPPFTVRAADSGEWVVLDMTSHTGVIGSGSDLLSLVAYLSGADDGSVIRGFMSPLIEFQSEVPAALAEIVARRQKPIGANSIVPAAPQRLARHLGVDASTPGRLAHLIAPPIAKRVLNRRYDAATFEISSLSDVIAKSYDLPIGAVACQLIEATLAVQFDPIIEGLFSSLGATPEPFAATADLFGGRLA